LRLPTRRPSLDEIPRTMNQSKLYRVSSFGYFITVTTSDTGSKTAPVVTSSKN
jgi:hypothetical protein